MIEIRDKHDCVGCRACEQICPKNCISMQADSEGFSYPTVNTNLCVNCNLCEKVCPCINIIGQGSAHTVFGCKSADKQIQLASSSGGAFTELARTIIKNGGLVFGAVFDENFKVVHSSTDSIDDLDRFRRSKYVQSDTRNAFTLIKGALNAGRKVLFCGTPCQVKGLNLFLRKTYPNLFTVDFICHGVPSPKVWSDYLHNLRLKMGNEAEVTDVNFRSKTKGGWHRFSIRISLRNTSSNETAIVEQYPGQNAYYQLFSQNISLRPSCFHCPAKNFASGSDFTLGDFWGIQNTAPTYDDNNGVTLLAVNSAKGLSLLKEVRLDKFYVSLEQAVSENPSLFHSVSEPAKRKKFFSHDGMFTVNRLNKYSGLDLYGRTRRCLIELALKIIRR